MRDIHFPFVFFLLLFFKICVILRILLENFHRTFLHFFLLLLLFVHLTVSHVEVLFL